MRQQRQRYRHKEALSSETVAAERRRKASAAESPTILNGDLTATTRACASEHTSRTTSTKTATQDVHCTTTRAAVDYHNNDSLHSNNASSDAAVDLLSAFFFTPTPSSRNMTPNIASSAQGELSVCMPPSEEQLSNLLHDDNGNVLFEIALSKRPKQCEDESSIGSSLSTSDEDDENVLLGGGANSSSEEEEEDDDDNEVAVEVSSERQDGGGGGGATTLTPPPPMQLLRSRLLRFRGRRHASNKTTLLVIQEELDVETYMAKRQMTRQQEHWNAYTMLPSPLFCLYYLISGAWYQQAIDLGVVNTKNNTRFDAGFMGLANDLVDLAAAATAAATTTTASNKIDGCLPWSSWTPCLPPLPCLAVAAALLLHAPCSFLYHYKYAHALPAGAPRTNHWSRRLDQSMIHFGSACMCFATTGSWDYFVVNAFYNIDSVVRLWQRQVRPRRNKIRLVVSFVAYTLPLLVRGEVAMFAQVWVVFAIGFWLFGAYPVGGWSHALFHLVMCVSTPLFFQVALALPASQDQILLAAQCV